MLTTPTTVDLTPYGFPGARIDALTMGDVHREVMRRYNALSPDEKRAYDRQTERELNTLYKTTTRYRYNPACR